MHRRQPIIILGIAVVAGVISVFVVAAPTWVVLYAILLVLLFLPPLLDLLTGRFDLMEAKNVVIGYWGLDYGLGIVNTIVLGQREFVQQTDFERMLPVTLACLDVSLALFYLGYYSPIGPRLANACPRLNGSWKRNRVNLVVAATTTAGLGIYLRLLADQGGLRNMFVQQEQLAASELGKYYLVLLSLRVPMLATLVCYLWARSTGSRNHRIAAAGLLAATFAIGSTLGARGAPLRTVLACWVAAYYTPPVKRLSRAVKVSLAAAIAAFLVVVLAVQSAIRAGGYFPGLTSSELIVEASRRTEVFGLDAFLKEFVSRFMAVEELERILERTGRSVDPEHGKTFLEMFYGIVPRALWPEKPDGMPLIAGKLFMDRAAVGNIYWFPTITWPGELYWNAFWPGVILGMLASGIFCRSVYAYFRLNLNPSGILLYIPMLIFLQSFDTGGFGALVVEAMAFYVPVAGIYLALTA